MYFSLICLKYFLDYLTQMNILQNSHKKISRLHKIKLFTKNSKPGREN